MPLVGFARVYDVSLLIQNRLKEGQTCVSVEEVNVLSIDMQIDVLPDTGFGTRINTSHHLFALDGHVNQQFTAQVFDDFNGRAHA